MLFKSRFSLLRGENRPSGRVERWFLSKGVEVALYSAKLPTHFGRWTRAEKRYTNVCSQPKIFVSVPCNEPNLAGTNRRNCPCYCTIPFLQTLQQALYWVDLLKQARVRVFCRKNVRRLLPKHTACTYHRKVYVPETAAKFTNEARWSSAY
jgi:hypothetical protein